MKSLLLHTVAPLLMLSCSSSLHVPQGTQAEREKFKTTLISSTIEGALSLTLTRETEPKWEQAFWGMGLVRYTSGKTTEAIHEAFKQWGMLSPSFQRALLEVVYTMYPDDCLPQVDSVFLSTKSEKLFAMASLYILRASRRNEAGRVFEQMQRRFPNHASHPILRMLHEDILDHASFTPPIVELLAAPFERGKPVVFSLQRKNRRMSGLALVRDANGRFARLNDSTYFSVPQLALASSNLPGYLTNGNTPQGIFSVQGFGRSENVFIGPTMNIQMVLPFEVKPFEYFHSRDKSDSLWTRKRYEDLLPESWKSYLPIYAAYDAGEAGRCDIIAHGSTVDPEFYDGEPFFPNAPTLGCLSAAESWSLENGERVSSDQQKLVDMMKEIGFEEGYLVVVELNAEQRAVTLEEVSPLLASVDEQSSFQVNDKFCRFEKSR